MRKAGRKAWSEADFDHAAGVANRILVDLGFDVAGWTVMAGLARNEPEAVPKRGRRRARQTPVQLSLPLG